MIEIEKLPSQLMASELVKLLQEQIKKKGDAPVWLSVAGYYSPLKTVRRDKDESIRLGDD